MGFYMCMKRQGGNPNKQGQGGERKRIMCVADVETEKKQLKGQAECGCCGDDCPSACTADNSMTCDKEDDTGGIVPGFYMCMKQGNNRERIMCVGAEETEKRQKNGQAECGCCGEDCSTKITTCDIAETCTKEDDTGAVVNGVFMCMRGRKTMCVAGENEIKKKQMQGQAECGCCGGNCPAPKPPSVDGETSEDGDEEDDEEDEDTSTDANSEII